MKEESPGFSREECQQATTAKRGSEPYERRATPHGQRRGTSPFIRQGPASCFVQQIFAGAHFLVIASEARGYVHACPLIEALCAGETLPIDTQPNRSNTALREVREGML